MEISQLSTHYLESSSDVMDCLCPPLPPTSCWSLIPWCGDIWRWGLLQVIRASCGHEGPGLMMGLALVEGETLPSLLPLSVRRGLSTSQEGNPHRKQTLLDLDLGPSSLYNCKKIHFCVTATQFMIFCYSRWSWLIQGYIVSLCFLILWFFYKVTFLKVVATFCKARLLATFFQQWLLTLCLSVTFW